MTDYHICLKTWVGIFRVGIFRGQIHQGGIWWVRTFRVEVFGGGSREFSQYHFKPIENCPIKIHYVYFKDFNILFKTVRHQKIYFLTTQIFF